MGRCDQSLRPGWGPDRRRAKPRACHGAEFNVGGHQFGNPNRKSSDLLMDVHQEGVRAPTAHHLDLDVRAFVKMHGHSSPSSEGMATNIALFIAKFEEVISFG